MSGLYTYYLLLRPVAWICFLLPFAVGLGIGAGEKTELFKVFLATISFASWMSFSFVVNAIYDKEVDKYHDGRTKDVDLSKQPLVTGEISVKKAQIISFLSLLVSIFSAYLINQNFLIAMILANFIGLIYSAPPRLKSKPIADVVCNAAAASLIFYAGMSVSEYYASIELYLAAFILAATFYIPTAVSDFEFDKLVGLKTTPVFFGPEKTLKSLYIFAVFTVLLWIHVFISSEKLLIKILSPLITVYTIFYVSVVNRRWNGRFLRVSPNLILAPFALISIILYLYIFVIIFLKVGG